VLVGELRRERPAAIRDARDKITPAIEAIYGKRPISPESHEILQIALGLVESLLDPRQPGEPADLPKPDRP
jgi:hypothetical protein